mmetsp:Transcript_28830/g.66970  ORF Transcript_28830/g.66970 Transcript_28830/m.66970 type:complete len:286 (-) Transcript_28830:264-1121(-)
MHVCRLSHYLFTVTTGCGIDLLDEDLVSFGKAHLLPPHRQEEIFRLAYMNFSPAQLINQTMFYDESGRMIGGAESEIRPVKDARYFFADIPTHVNIMGKQVPVNHVLVFKKVWLENNYLKPLKKYRPLKRIVKEDPTKTLNSLLSRILNEDSQHGRTRGLDPRRNSDRNSETASITSNNSQQNRRRPPARLGRQPSTNSEGQAPKQFPNADDVTPIATATPVTGFGFQPGQMVLLTKLKNEAMNGNAGIVESFVPGGQRVNVRLSHSKVVCVKPENLEIAAEIVD